MEFAWHHFGPRTVSCCFYYGAVMTGLMVLCCDLYLKEKRGTKKGTRERKKASEGEGDRYE